MALASAGNLSGGRGQPGGIVFDLDDTLYLQADFKRSSFKAVGNWLEAEGLAPSALATETLEHILRDHGPSYGSMFDRLADRLKLDPALVPGMVEVLRSHRPELELFPGVREMLLRLSGRTRLGLLTDGLARVQRAKVAGLKIEGLFNRIVYSDELGTNKPDERLFAIFEEEFALPGSSLVYVADNPEKDFFGASGRGWLTVRVRTGEHDRDAASPGWDAAVTVDRATDAEALFPEI